MRRGSWERILAAQILLLGPAAVAVRADTLQSKDFLTDLSPASIVRAVSVNPAPPVALPNLLQGPALPNFAQVSPILYRSGQPTQEGVSELAAKGVKTILKFNIIDPAEASWTSAAGIKLIHQTMSPIASPSYAEVDAALAVINDPANQPVDVHCHRGRDRTGTVVAAYRVTVQGWSVNQAVTEATSFGYGSPGFEDLTTWLNGYLAQRK